MSKSFEERLEEAAKESETLDSGKKVPKHYYGDFKAGALWAASELKRENEELVNLLKAVTATFNLDATSDDYSRGGVELMADKRRVGFAVQETLRKHGK